MSATISREIEPKKIPSALTTWPSWVTWLTEQRGGHATKVPYNARSGRKAQSTCPATWAPFGVALSASRRGYDGLGFVFSVDDPFFGLDLDGCRNRETGVVAAWARDIIVMLDTYGEVSPSETGVKLFAVGKLPAGARNKWKVKDAPTVCDKTPGVEVYDRRRYFCTTGWKLKGPAEPQPRQAQLDALLASCPKPNRSVVPDQNDRHHHAARATPSIISRARKYVATMPGAISGQFGHDATFHVACKLVLGYGLSPDDAWAVFVEWNQKCVPPWDEHDLRRKLSEADKQPGERGRLLGATL